MKSNPQSITWALMFLLLGITQYVAFGSQASLVNSNKTMLSNTNGKTTNNSLIIGDFNTSSLYSSEVFELNPMIHYKLINKTSFEVKELLSPFLQQDDKGNYNVLFHKNQYTLTLNIDPNSIVEGLKLTPINSTKDEYIAILKKGFDEKSYGAFFGAKFSGRQSGVKQTIDETISLFEGDVSDLRIVSVFNPAPGIYFVLDWNKSTYTISLCRNYLPINITSLIEAIQTPIETFRQKHFYICNRINLFGLIKLNFPALKNKRGTLFTMDCVADEKGEYIKEITITLNNTDNTNIEKSIEIWKNETNDFLSLSKTPIELYATDATGKKTQRFKTIEEAKKFVENDQRTHGVTILTQVNDRQVALVINKGGVFYLINKAHEKPAISLHYTLPLDSPLSFEVSFDKKIRIDWGDGKIEPYEKGNVISGKLRGQHIYIFGAITKFNAESTNLESIDVSGAKQLTSLECANNKLTEIYLGDNNQLVELDLENNAIKNIDLEKLTKLQKLLIGGNKLREIKLEDLNSLLRLQIDNNPELSYLRLSTLPKLKTLTASNCALTELDLGNNTTIEKLIAGNNKIQTIDLRKQTEIQWISLPNNKLTSVLLPIKQKLNTLDLSYNLLNNFELQNGETIKELNLAHNKLSTINTSTWKHVMRLNLSSNSLQYIDVSNNKFLRDLYAYDNKLTSDTFQSIAENIYSRNGENEPGHLYYLQKGNNDSNRFTMDAIKMLHSKNWDIYEVIETTDGITEHKLSIDELEKHPNDNEELIHHRLVYCNYYDGQLHFNIKMDKVLIYDLSGRCVETFSNRDNSFPIHLSNGQCIIISYSNELEYNSIVITP